MGQPEELGVRSPDQLRAMAALYEDESLPVMLTVDTVRAVADRIETLEKAAELVEEAAAAIKSLRHQLSFLAVPLGMSLAINVVLIVAVAVRY